MPSDKPEPEKSRVTTVIFDERSITAASFASALQPLQGPERKIKLNFENKTIEHKIHFSKYLLNPHTYYNVCDYIKKVYSLTRLVEQLNT